MSAFSFPGRGHLRGSGVCQGKEYWHECCFSSSSARMVRGREPAHAHKQERKLEENPLSVTLRLSFNVTNKVEGCETVQAGRILRREGKRGGWNKMKVKE